MGNLADLDKFKELLDDEYDWPVDYMFKFIVPANQKDLFVKSLKIQGYTERPSKTGKYFSITFHLNVNCADDVLFIYDQASQIEGVLSF